MAKGGLYLALGDSITWNNYQASPTKLYPTLAYRALDGASPIKHINKGIGGTQTNKLLTIMPQWIKGLPYDLVTLGIGMNDCANDNVGAVNYGNNLRSIVDKLKLWRPNCEIILCAPNQTSEATRTPYIASYRAQMQTVATEKNVKFCDFSTAFTSGDVATHTNDGIHPIDIGHQKIFDILWPVIQTTNFYTRLNS